MKISNVNISKSVWLSGSLLVATAVVALLPFHGFAADQTADAPGTTDKTGHHHFHHEEGFLQNRFIHQLDLTKDQAAQLSSIKAETRTKTHDTREALKQKMRDLVTYSSSANSDQATALAKLKEVQQLKNQMEDEMLGSWFELKSHLTPEQLGKLVTLENEKMDQMKDWMNKREKAQQDETKK